MLNMSELRVKHVQYECARDLTYIFRYRNVAEERIISTIKDYFKKIRKEKA
jgi:hypothetical protein